MESDTFLHKSNQQTKSLTFMYTNCVDNNDSFIQRCYGLCLLIRSVQKKLLKILHLYITSNQEKEREPIVIKGEQYKRKETSITCKETENMQLTKDVSYRRKFIYDSTYLVQYAS
jgi:hypothetical protein